MGALRLSEARSAMVGFYLLDAIMGSVGLAAKLSLVLSIILAILVVTVGGTFLSYGRALESDGMPTMARVVSWNGEIRYRYIVNEKHYENTDAPPRGFTGLDGSYVRIKYLPYRPDVSHMAPAELAARGGMILLVGMPLAALLIWASAARLSRQQRKAPSQ
jgi:hypothetical protein